MNQTDIEKNTHRQKKLNSITKYLMRKSLGI